MGNVNYEVFRFAAGNAFAVRWASLSTSSGTADRGQAFPASTDLGLMSALWSDKSVMMYRPSGSTCQVVIQGSNQSDVVASSDLVWATLNDPNGNGLQLGQASLITPPVLEAVLENCCFISPVVSTVSTTTEAATVWLLFSSVRPNRAGF